MVWFKISYFTTILTGKLIYSCIIIFWEPIWVNNNDWDLRLVKQTSNMHKNNKTVKTCLILCKLSLGVF